MVSTHDHINDLPFPKPVKNQLLNAPTQIECYTLWNHTSDEAINARPNSVYADNPELAIWLCANQLYLWLSYAKCHLPGDKPYDSESIAFTHRYKLNQGYIPCGPWHPKHAPASQHEEDTNTFQYFYHAFPYLLITAGQENMPRAPLSLPCVFNNQLKSITCNDLAIQLGILPESVQAFWTIKVAQCLASKPMHQAQNDLIDQIISPNTQQTDWKTCLLTVPQWHGKEAALQIQKKQYKHLHDFFEGTRRRQFVDLSPSDATTPIANCPEWLTNPTATSTKPPTREREQQYHLSEPVTILDKAYQAVAELFPDFTPFSTRE